MRSPNHEVTKLPSHQVTGYRLLVD